MCITSPVDITTRDVVISTLRVCLLFVQGLTVKYFFCYFYLALFQLILTRRSNLAALPKRGIILDLDNTILDSAGESCERVRYLADQCGLSVESNLKEAILNSWKKSSDSFAFVQSIWPEECTAKIVAFLNAWITYDQIVPYNLFPGVKKALAVLQHFFYLSVLTNRSYAETLSQLQMNKIDKYFNFIGAPDGPIGSNARKPALASFQPLWRKYKQINISKDNIFLIGDTVESDFRLARVCGLKFFAVISDIFTREEFLAAGVRPDCILDSVAELPALLVPSSK